MPRRPPAREQGAGLLPPKRRIRGAPAALPRVRPVMETPRAQTTARTPSQSAQPLQAGPEEGWGPGRGLAAEPGRLRGGRALTRGLGARRGPDGEGASKLLWAKVGGGDEGNSEEPAARAAGHRQPCRILGPSALG